MMSIFVPKTFGFSAERINGLVERDLGEVRQVDMVKETCFIHLYKWYECGTRGHAYPTFLAIDRMERGEAHKITSFDQSSGQYKTMYLLKNHSKKQCQDVLEKIEEGEGGVDKDKKAMSLSLVHPDLLNQQEAIWRPPSPPGPPPPRPPLARPPPLARETGNVRQNRTEGRSATDDQYIHKLEKEIASLRAQNHAQVKDINDLRVQIYQQQIEADAASAARSVKTYNTAPAEECEEQVDQALDANNEYNAKAVPKPRKRAAPKASNVDFRLETF